VVHSHTMLWWSSDSLDLTREGAEFALGPSSCIRCFLAAGRRSVRRAGHVTFRAHRTEKITWRENFPVLSITVKRDLSSQRSTSTPRREWKTLDMHVHNGNNCERSRPRAESA